MEWSSKGFFIDFHVLNMNSIDKKELLPQYSSIPFYTSSLTSLNIVDHTDYLLVGGISKGGYSVRFLALLGDQGLFNIVKTAIPSIYEAIEKKPRIHGSLKIWIVTTLGNSTTYLLTNNDGSFVAYVVMVIDWSEEELANYVEVMYRSLKHGVTSIELDDEIFYLVEKIPGSIRERGAFIAIDERNDLWIMGYHSRVEVFYTQGRGVEKIFVDYYVIKPGNETKLTDIESKALFGFNKPESIEMIGASDNYVLLRVKGGAKIFE